MPSVPTPEPSSHGPLVLVAEDEFLTALDLKLLLERHGYRVLGPAATVAEALGLLVAETPEAALLDVNLRGERVTPVAEALRGVGGAVPVGERLRRTRARCRGLAEALDLGKPTSERRLLAALAQAVGQRSGR